MKKINRAVLLSSIGLVLLSMIGMTACSESSLSGNNVHQQPTPLKAKSQTPGTGGSTMQFVLSPSSVRSADNVAVQAVSGDSLLTVASSFSQPGSQTTIVTASAGTQSSDTLGYTIDATSAAANSMTTQVTYEGGSTISYTVDGQQNTASLNQQQQELLTDVQQQVNSAQTAYNNMPASVDRSNPLLSKSDQQIKQMLQSKGFSVMVLGNKRFRLTETDGDITTSRIFDAQTFSVSNYKINYQGDQAYGDYFKNGTIQTSQKIAK